MIRRGVIASFEKNYGMITPDDGGKAVYFHLADRKKVVLKDEAVILDGLSEGSATPQQGDRVVFEVQKRKRNTTLTVWAFTTPYGIAQGHLNKMPLSRVIREVVTRRGGKLMASETVWTGKDHGQVAGMFPPFDQGQPFGRLFGTPIQTVYRIETQEDGQWPEDASASPTEPVLAAA